jgi:hypothetical protein
MNQPFRLFDVIYEDARPKQMFGRIRLSIQRTQQLLDEVELCCAPIIHGSPPSQDLMVFLRVVQTGNPQLMVSALADALHKGVTAEEMETALRIGDQNLWLLGTKKDLSVPLSGWAPDEEPILCMAVNPFEEVAGTVFKERGSYTANFNRLNKAWPLPCDCHPKRPTKSA